MMIETLISMSRYLTAHKDDDFADRMNYLYTPNMLLAFSVLISFKQFGGSPLECMFPNKFPGSWEQYAENFCWSEDTYYLPPEIHVAQIKESERYSEDKKLSYYQWVPFFLLLQAACFRIPSLLWKAASLSSGVRVHDIVVKALDSQNMDDECRHKTIILLANHLARALRFQNKILNRHLFIHKTMRFLNITYSTCLISFIYLFTKFLYLFNVFAQLYLMNKFLETDKYQWYGISVIQNLMLGIPWQASGYFPRVSLCDFTIRQMANIQKYSVQCVLVINIFNEKIFILLWFWYLILLISTSISFIYWSTIMLFPQFGNWYISQALELCQIEPTEKQLDLYKIKKERKNVKCFVNEFLKNDGVFVIRMIGMHTGILFTCELTSELYRIHLELLLKNNNSEKQHFISEDTTLKLEDGIPLKINNKNKKRRADSAPLVKEEEKELKTSLLPINNKINEKSSSSSNSSSSSKENQIESDNNDNKIK